MDLRMAESVMGDINNWFPQSVSAGEFEIANGSFTSQLGIKDGQYFRIRGSVFNDGLHRWPASDLIDETFQGEVWLLAVPALFAETVDKIKEYEAQTKTGPYQSESFGGYSYTLATDSNGAPLSWRTVFRSTLNRWRRLPCS